MLKFANKYHIIKIIITFAKNKTNKNILLMEIIKATLDNLVKEAGWEHETNAISGYYVVNVVVTVNDDSGDYFDWTIRCENLELSDIGMRSNYKTDVSYTALYHMIRRLNIKFEEFVKSKQEDDDPKEPLLPIIPEPKSEPPKSKKTEEVRVDETTKLMDGNFNDDLALFNYFDEGILLVISEDIGRFKVSIGIKNSSVLDYEDLKEIWEEIGDYQGKHLSKSDVDSIIKELYYIFKDKIQDKKEPIPEPKEEPKKQDEQMKGKITLEDQILDLVKEGVTSKRTNDLIAKTVKDKLDEWGIRPHTKEIVIKQSGKKPKKVSSQHKDFETLLLSIKAKVNVAMVGPAGSGKTTAVKKVADVLELPFYSKSVSAQTGQHEFFGYQDATGNYVRTLFRDAYENGGVFLLDEFDAGNPNVLAALNQATANGNCAFADTMIEKHEDFVIVMAGNTFGHGATTEYVGRNKIDAATLDRFAFIHWPYDEDFEMQLATNKDWCNKVQSIRKKVRDKKIKTIVSPRATLDGEKLLEAGLSEDQVLQLMIYKGLSEEEITMIRN